MRIANVILDFNNYIGIVKNNYFYPFEKIGIRCRNVNELIQNYSLDELIQAIKKFSDNDKINLANAKFLAPIPFPLQNVLCLGLNYQAHIEESMRYKHEDLKPVAEPVYFSKRVTKATSPFGVIDAHRDLTSKLDYEAELAVIIGHDAYKVKKDKAYNYVFGYTIINDVSARDVQMAHKEWHFGKSLDTFCPMGPVIVTKDEIDANNLFVKSYVNGELRQNGNTKDFIFPIDYIIEDLTKGMTLTAGTIISTGTPSGVGMGFNPPKFLAPGDIVKCEIENIGYIENIIK